MSYDGYGIPQIKDGQDHLGGNINEGDPYTYCPTVWNYLIDRFCIKSVMDLGSGRGHCANYFFNKGIKTVAIDGLDYNVMYSFFPTVKQDLTKGPVFTRVDLVHCQEVVEHISEEFLENLLSSLTCASYVLMTHALPGQEGHHHVNCQPKEYWINHLKKRSYHLLSEDTNRIKKMAEKDGAIYMAQSGLFFARR